MPHPTSLAVMADCLRRRAGAIALTLTIGLVIALNLALAQQPLFSARETLRIAPPKVAAGMVATTVSVPMAQQVPLLRDRVLAPDVLEDIVRAYELFLDVPEAPLAERGARLRDAVRIDFLPDGTLAACK